MNRKNNQMSQLISIYYFQVLIIVRCFLKASTLGACLKFMFLKVSMLKEAVLQT